MKPYYERDGIVIYHADCRDVLPALSDIDLVLTDPPYGLASEDSNAGNSRVRGKADYGDTEWDDTPEYVESVCVEVIRACLMKSKRMILTPGKRMMFSYPKPDDMGCWYAPADAGWDKWGRISAHPVFYYGKVQNENRDIPTSLNLPKFGIEKNLTGHPCPKPLRVWKYMLAKGSLAGDMVLDPFMGSGTTLVAAKHLNRRTIGIEIEERYCEIAAERLSQEVMELAV